MIKNNNQIEDLRRRASLYLSSDGPMVRLLREDGVQFGYLPTSECLATTTPLGHYKTKVAELGIDPDELVMYVEDSLTRQGDSFAFHNEDGRPVGSRMYFAIKQATLDIVDPQDVSVGRIINDTFLI